MSFTCHYLNQPTLRFICMQSQLQFSLVCIIILHILIVICKNVQPQCCFTVSA